MDVVHLVDEKVLSVVKKACGLLEGEVVYQEFEVGLKQELDDPGCEILKVVFEETDQR